MRYGVTCTSDSKTIATKKRLTRRTTLPTSKALLLSLVLAIFASLSLFMPSALRAQAEGAANDTSYAMSVGNRVLADGAKRAASEDIISRFYLGTYDGSPVSWDVLGSANTSTSGIYDFTSDKNFANTVEEGKWGVYDADDSEKDITESSVLVISSNDSLFGWSEFAWSGDLYYNGTDNSVLATCMAQRFGSCFAPEEEILVGYTYKADSAYQGQTKYRESKSELKGAGVPVDILSGSRFFPSFWARSADVLCEQ